MAHVLPHMAHVLPHMAGARRGRLDRPNVRRGGLAAPSPYDARREVSGRAAGGGAAARTGQPAGRAAGGARDLRVTPT
eukprot:3685870-Prymnesium_polylepis.1